MSGARPVALVTGASSGIGRAIARRLAVRGHDLVLVARSEGELRALAAEVEGADGARAEVLPADLSDPVAVDALVERVEVRGIPVEVLVNNAGFGLYGPFVEEDPERERAMIQVNALALTALCRRFVPAMVERGHGRVLNVASTAAFQPGPLMAVYYATKAYVLSFSVALAVELEETGVTVTTLCPGPTRTGFARAAGAGRSALFAGGAGMDVETVARKGVEAMLAGERIAIPGVKNRLGAMAARIVPPTLAARLVERIQAAREG